MPGLSHLHDRMRGIDTAMQDLGIARLGAGAQTLLLAVTACIMLAAGFSITTARSRRR